MSDPMDELPDSEERLRHSWTVNADAWTRTVREHRIESRRLVTDAAVLDAVVARAPRRVLDVGCGEGWLCRALTERGIEAVGIDASSPLVASARALGGGTFHTLSYAALTAGDGHLGRFDAVVCNFALLAQDLVPLLGALRALLAEGGALIVQTVHPWSGGGEGPYRDGWRTETFDSFDEAFAEPMPWYFRTLASWSTSLREAGFVIEGLREPVHPETQRPLSLLVSAVPVDR